MLAKFNFSCALCEQERKTDEICYGIGRACNTISHYSFMRN